MAVIVGDGAARIGIEDGMVTLSACKSITPHEARTLEDKLKEYADLAEAMPNSATLRAAQGWE